MNSFWNSVFILFILINFIGSIAFTKISKKFLINKGVHKSYLNAHPRIEFEYCTGCKWMLRSAYYAQELLTTFEKEIGEVALIPCKTEAGTFIIRIDGNQVWNRKNESTPGFPDIKDLKQIVRDIVSPSKSLGHSDNKNKIIEL